MTKRIPWEEARTQLENLGYSVFPALEIGHLAVRDSLGGAWQILIDKGCVQRKDLRYMPGWKMPKGKQ